MQYKDQENGPNKPNDKPPEKVGIGHAYMHQKMLDKAKKLWKGGGC